MKQYKIVIALLDSTISPETIVNLAISNLEYSITLAEKSYDRDVNYEFFIVNLRKEIDTLKEIKCIDNRLEWGETVFDDELLEYGENIKSLLIQNAWDSTLHRAAVALFPKMMKKASRNEDITEEENTQKSISSIKYDIQVIEIGA